MYIQIVISTHLPGEEVAKLVEIGADMGATGKLPLTPEAHRVIEQAAVESRVLNHHHVGIEHLLLSMLQESDYVAAVVLANLGLELEDVRAEVLDLMGVGLES